MAMSMRKAIRRVCRPLMVGAVFLAMPPSTIACGYHDDASVARGILNWTYPDALHVVGAMAQAVTDRRLPAPMPARNPWGYQDVVRLLHQHGQQLQIVSGETRPTTFSLLLIEPMLWTRFAVQGDGLQIQVHVSAPQPEDLVLISGEDVVRQIANRRLSIGDAHRLGLMRFYGSEDQVARFLALYDQIGRPRSAH
jgi:hypothetical protein